MKNPLIAHPSANSQPTSALADDLMSLAMRTERLRKMDLRIATETSVHGTEVIATDKASRTTVTATVSRNGAKEVTVTRFPSDKSARETEMEDRFATGTPRKQIARKSGYSASTVYNATKRLK